jgi:hypothetical protein
MIAFFLSPIGKYVALGLLLALGYGGCQVKGCLDRQARERAKVAETTLEVKDEQKKRQDAVDKFGDDDVLRYWVGCSETVKLARPPLPDKPHLGSLALDKNDRTTEPGWWMSDPDMRNLIKAWEGVYELKGKPELLDVAYNTGLGAKNSQGLGCFEVVVD